ncbi:hypothetical protein GCM10009678_10700 [Actinomadura kijaniata]|uniref:DUF1963 domain-containing protein n=1 Tax=Actinomadura namibiensis TaxID=182080 RepID=A0A7W3LJF1_ACTNM|nr:DUF1963 domain-containing protein [Actinomadura namibiensis]MBA8949190.1 hypothetical protein [Actinomadura namibiensis]
MRDLLREALDEHGDPESAEAVLSLVRPAVALEVGEGASVYGGLPPLPAGMEWPVHRGQALTLLVRLDCASLAPLYDGDWPLPRDGVLLFFYDDWFGFRQGEDTLADEFPVSPGCRVLHVPGDDPERPAPDGTHVIPPLPLDARPALSVPDHTAPELERLWKSGNVDIVRIMGACVAARDALPASRHLLFGWDEHDVAPGHGRPLLQVSAEEGTAWGEITGIEFLISEEDLGAGRLDRVRYALDVA